MLTISPFLVIDDNTKINNDRARKIKQDKHKQKLESRTKELNGSNEIHRYVSKNGILKRQMYISMN